MDDNQSNSGCGGITTLQNKQRVTSKLMGMLVLISALVAVESAFAKQEPKTYPEEGKVVGTGTSDVHGSGPHGDNTLTMPSYKIETNTKIYQVRCSNSFACGGKNKLEIGEVVRFRVGTKMRTRCLFFQAPGDDKERTVVILSEDLKPDAKTAN